MKWSPCLDTMYPKAGQREALTEIKTCGCDAFEFWFWRDRDIKELALLCKELEMRPVNFCNQAPDITDPRNHPAFLEELKRALEVCGQLGCERLAIVPGNDIGRPRPEQHEAIVRALSCAVELLVPAGVTAVVEASNRRVNRPRNFLCKADELFDIIKAIGSPWVRALYDIYHQQITEGDLLARMLPNLEKIGHIHAAGVPGRHELDCGEINYPGLFAQLVQAGYSGYIGLEYLPLEPPAEGLRRLIAW